MARMEEDSSVLQILTDKPITRMDLKEIGVNTSIWVDSAQVRNFWRALVNAALNLRFP